MRLMQTAVVMSENKSMADKDSGETRSRTPNSKQFLDFMASSWAAADPLVLDVKPEAAASAMNHRGAIAALYPDRVLLIQAGSNATRSNDTEYRYRPHSAFSHLTGWGADTVPDSVLVIDTRQSAVGSRLYLRATANKDSREFFANQMIGEFWVGTRPSLAQVADALKIETVNLVALDDDLAGVPDDIVLTLENSELLRDLAELRLVKDAYEIAEMRKAVAATLAGFEDVVRALPLAQTHPRGERIIETAFFAKARLEGNDLGYETIAAAGSHACVLHWIKNDGPAKSGDLLLLDAGVELDSLYTADITRTMPINGKFSAAQREVYEAVLEAADAVFAVAKPGVKFREMHETAMRVIAKHTSAWGQLPISEQQTLLAENQFHRRWMIHGTGHHLGLDVHDCAQARREIYMESALKPGMIFTIEPGLYFHPEDELVRPEFRGIGVRIEDDVLVTETGVENLSAALPRGADEIESWMAKILR